MMRDVLMPCMYRSLLFVSHFVVVAALIPRYVIYSSKQFSMTSMYVLCFMPVSENWKIADSSVLREECEVRAGISEAGLLAS